MRRLFWLGIGLAVGVLTVRALTKATRKYGPTGLVGAARSSATGALDGVRSFVADVRDGMAEREAEIRTAVAEGELLDGEHLSDPAYPATGYDGYDDEGGEGGEHDQGGAYPVDPARGSDRP